ncbi:cingulin-like protein 1 isoform X2 [Polypterus senegalus]|uniref:cingulin-like protein 1 isoform X2 n=1 Tax=Polypterus senegalus TaxID=55291 RepID=UPI0019637CBA|nr:cingulin-like protein 1 isoform X2 [Polypterus senegalus]
MVKAQMKDLETQLLETNAKVPSATESTSGDGQTGPVASLLDARIKENGENVNRGHVSAEDLRLVGTTSTKEGSKFGTSLRRSGSVKDLIQKFSYSEDSKIIKSSPFRRSTEEQKSPIENGLPCVGNGPLDIKCSTNYSSRSLGDHAGNEFSTINTNILLNTYSGYKQSPRLSVAPKDNTTLKTSKESPMALTDSQSGLASNSKQDSMMQSVSKAVSSKVNCSPRYQLYLSSESLSKDTTTPSSQSITKSTDLNGSITPGETEVPRSPSRMGLTELTSSGNGRSISSWLKESTLLGNTKSTLESSVSAETSNFGSTPNLYKRDLDELSSHSEVSSVTGGKDDDTLSEKAFPVESPRVFNSPYKSSIVDYDRFLKSTDYKDCLSPTLSDMSASSMNSYSTYGHRSSVAPSPTTALPQGRFTVYESWGKLKGMLPTLPNLRPGIQNKRDYIQELIRLLDISEKRNTFLEAESVEMSKERTQIRYEMRGLLVQNEDLIRNTSLMQNDLKNFRNRVLELEQENKLLNDKISMIEAELMEAREALGEARDQEYAFSYLQESLNNKMLDIQEILEKKNQRCENLEEKLWQAERNQQDLETEKQNLDKKIVELSSTVLKLETELGVAVQASGEATAGMNMFQQYKEKTEETLSQLEDSLHEKSQELEEKTLVLSRLQDEFAVKLLDKDQRLEEETQLRERFQLQAKQAERHIEDLHLEIQGLTQTKEDLNKQLKSNQEKILDLESDLEELHDNEQRLAAKFKRSSEQLEQLQIKLIQEREAREQLESENSMLERQNKDLIAELRDLRSSHVEEDILSKSEMRAKELESTLRAEERNKIILTSSLQKMERKVKELSEQLEEEHRHSEENKDQLMQKIKNLKRQLNDAEEEIGRRDVLQRQNQRELEDQKESNRLLQRQFGDLQHQLKRKESYYTRSSTETLNRRLIVDDYDDGDDDENQEEKQKG